MNAIVVDADERTRPGLAAHLRDAGVGVRDFSSIEASLQGIAGVPHVSLVFLDVRSVARDPMRLAFLARLNAMSAPPIVVGVSQGGLGESEMDGCQLPADHFLPRPVDRLRLQRVLGRALPDYLLRREVSEEFPLLGGGLSMQNVRSETARIARSDAHVLIIGEDDLATTCAACRVHACSSRGSRPLEVYHCSGSQLNPSRTVAELLGEVEGDDRERLRPGAFHRAHRGTLLLEDVTDLPLVVQDAILHAVETGEVRAVGSDGAEHLDVRVIATIGLDAQEAITAGTLRPGLYHRLAGEEVSVPPLREHPEDVPDLIIHWADRVAPRPQWVFEPRAMAALTAYGWAGNTLELRNASSRLARSGRETITLDLLPPAIVRAYRRTLTLMRLFAGTRSRRRLMAEAAATRVATTLGSRRRAPHASRAEPVGGSPFQTLARSLRAGMACVVCGVASLLR